MGWRRARRVSSVTRRDSSSAATCRAGRRAPRVPPENPRLPPCDPNPLRFLSVFAVVVIVAALWPLRRHPAGDLNRTIALDVRATREGRRPPLVPRRSRRLPLSTTQSGPVPTSSGLIEAHYRMQVAFRAHARLTDPAVVRPLEALRGSTGEGTDSARTALTQCCGSLSEAFGRARSVAERAQRSKAEYSRSGNGDYQAFHRGPPRSTGAMTTLPGQRWRVNRSRTPYRADHWIPGPPRWRLRFRLVLTLLLCQEIEGVKVWPGVGAGAWSRCQMRRVRWRLRQRMASLVLLAFGPLARDVVPGLGVATQPGDSDWSSPGFVDISTAGPSWSSPGFVDI